ncbi:energy transducer TonB [Flavobacterium silvaticum]|uniref:Energy transducer TonB n=1 Tax=Flavobacterium silvaticum TaxID=1852020 RepID=A0A972FPU7_9FLAO|nr:energy transducer TonB [Flavobacterium silvaticum]NMH29658.1 energy transducer TonB [Flavobacterium silvaticum]
MAISANQKKSLAITSAIFGLFLLVLLVLKFNDSITVMADLEGGGGGGDVAVNFGDSEFGSGTNFESREPVKAKAKAVEPAKSSQEEVITSEADDAPSVADIKKADEKPKKPEEKKEAPKPERKPDKSTSNAISDLLNGSSTGGDGDDNRAGNKGRSNGDINSRGYEGGGGSGTGSGGGNGSGQGIGTGSGYGSGSGGGNGSGSGNWSLAGRKLSSSSKVIQKCNETGTVVVEVKVNRQGIVTGTKYVRGTTNTDPCLLQPAYATARTYKWNPNPDAPEVQIGTITINFSVGE